jgi:integrase
MDQLGQNPMPPNVRDCGNVLAEAFQSGPSKGAEAMARRRCQDPKPRKEGNWWVLYYYQDEIVKGQKKRRRKRKPLALATMPEREVRKIALEFLRPFNQGLVTIGSATKFEDYVENVYRPSIMPSLASSTQERYRGVIENHLKPAFGQLCLRDLTPLTVQRFLSGMAKSELSHESRDKIRDVLASILVSAVKFDYLVKNPVEGLRLPPDKTGRRQKPYIRPNLCSVLLDSIPEPYSTMVFVALYTGFRVSELIGLRWRNIHEDSITIEARYCRGDWGRPKSEASNATVAVNPDVIRRILRLKIMTVAVKAGLAVRTYRVVKSDGPDDLVFQSLRSGGPMRDNNILVRHIKPAARKLGIGWVNWQVLRRSFATWLKLAGADVKDAQALMRHSRATTTLDTYQQFVPESQRQVVGRLSELVH